LPYYFFIWCIMHLGSFIVAVGITAYLFSDDIVEFFRESNENCPKRWPSIPEMIFKLVVVVIVAYIGHQILKVELLAIMLSIFLVPLVGLVLLASIFNTFELDSINLIKSRSLSIVTLGDIVGIVAILLLGLMVSSMDESMYMVKAGLVLAVIYMLIKLAIHYDHQT